MGVFAAVASDIKLMYMWWQLVELAAMGNYRWLSGVWVCCSFQYLIMCIHRSFVMVYSRGSYNIILFFSACIISFWETLPIQCSHMFETDVTFHVVMKEKRLCCRESGLFFVEIVYCLFFFFFLFNQPLWNLLEICSVNQVWGTQSVPQMKRWCFKGISLQAGRLKPVWLKPVQ